MKTTLNLVKKAGLVLAAVTFIANTAIAQESKQNPISKRAIENLKVGIMSDNNGLKRNSIYFAGKYRIAESVDALVAELNDTEDPSTRVLIAMSLYLIGEPKGLEAVYEIAKTDDNSRVRRLCNAIYAEYVKANESVASSEIGY